MIKTATIGLNESKATGITDLLNTYLANYQVHYQKVRGCHWNVTGPHFFQLHAKFEELYTNAQDTIDEIAERLLTLGVSPLSTLSSYLDQAEIREIKTEDASDETLVNSLLDDFKILISLERQILSITSEAGDDGTNDLVNGFMQFKEKNSWMLEAFLSRI